MKPSPLSLATADREVETIVRCPRKCSATPPAIDESALTPEQLSNLRAKRRFVDRIHEVLGDDDSVRDLALYFGVKKSHLHERMREKRTDLAPLPEWFEKLDRHEEFNKLYAEFCAVSA